MHPFVLVVAMSATVVPSVVSKDPVWFKDYHRARVEGQERQKPLFVVIGSGKAGYHDVSRDGRLSEEVRRLLAQHYVCLYVDTEHIPNRRLAEDFDMPRGPGLVISDASGRLQAFRHVGDLSNGRLAEHLRRYADRDRAVQETETNAEPRVSYYEEPAAAAPVAPVMAPAPVFTPAFGGFMGGGGGSC
jgi:hypothetical protein